MAELFEYKCPACGGAMEFDSKSQKMKCPYCDTELDTDYFSDRSADDTNKEEDNKSEEWDSYSNGEWSEGETDGIKVYLCDSCGGEIVADDTTGATTCPFCGNRLVVKGQFSGDIKPDFVIPFKIDKKQAKQGYLNHLKGKPFLPKYFKDLNHIDEIKGLYVPFWLFSGDAHADITYNGEKVRSWQSGNTRYTEISKYRLDRGGTFTFENIPYDGSAKIDNTLTEAVEPYDFSEAVPFQPAYLAGYAADRYDVNKEVSQTRIRERIKKSAETSLRSTVGGEYSSVNTRSSNLSLLTGNYKYVLYPMWILNTTLKDKKYLFALNGQTGKTVGDLPCDRGAFWRFIAIASAISSAVVYGIACLIKFLA